MTARVSMRNAVGQVVPRVSRAVTAVTRVGSVVSVAADQTEATVTVGGANVVARVLKGVVAAGQQVLVICDRESWIVLSPLPFAASNTFSFSSGTPQSITPSTITPVNLSASGSAPFVTGITVPVAGRYLVSGSATFNFTASGGTSRGVGIVVNALDANRRSCSVPWVANVYLTGVVAPHVRVLAANDVVGLQVQHNNATAITVNPNAEYSAMLAVQYIGP